MAVDEYERRDDGTRGRLLTAADDAFCVPCIVRAYAAAADYADHALKGGPADPAVGLALLRKADTMQFYPRLSDGARALMPPTVCYQPDGTVIRGEEAWRTDRRTTLKTRGPFCAFAVAGPPPFPLDMLRFDCCWPATEEDAAALVRSLRGLIPGRTLSQGGSTETICLRRPNTVGGPTVARWEVYGWHVVATGVAAEQVAR
jgi:hypothetical protein